MREIVFMNEIENTDLNIFQYGRESCTSGHYFGPAVRDHYLIHCISGGKGRFTIEDRSYELGKGQGFLIPPDMVTFYQADFDTPWSYSWVGFNGSSAGAFMKKAGLSAANPIFTFEPEDFLIKYLEELISAQKLGKSRNIQQTGLLYLFIASLVEAGGAGELYADSVTKADSYLNKAIEYINMNYSRQISVADVANHVGLNRSYIGSLFKNRLGTSIQEYLINLRIGKASLLLKDPKLSIGDISRSVGYDDPLHFSKAFRKTRQMSPRDYRKSMF